MQETLIFYWEMWWGAYISRKGKSASANVTDQAESQMGTARKDNN